MKIPLLLNDSMSRQTKQILNTSCGVTLTYYLWRKTKERRPLLVLLHGLGSNHTRWLEFIEYSQLTDHWDIIAPDLRGHGESLLRGEITMEIWAQDLSTILHHARYPHAVFIGHSMGAHLALYFYKYYPQQLRAMVLIDPLSKDSFTAKMTWFWRMRSIIYLVIAIIRFCNKLGLQKKSIPPRDLRDFDRYARELISQGKQGEMVRHYSSAWIDFKYNPVANYLQYTLQMLRPLPVLQAKDIAVLLLLSEGSAFNKGNAQHTLIEQFPNCTLATVPCNHWPLTEKPHEVAHIIESWLQGLRILNE